MAEWWGGVVVVVVVGGGGAVISLQTVHCMVLRLVSAVVARFGIEAWMSIAELLGSFTN